MPDVVKFLIVYILDMLGLPGSRNQHLIPLWFLKNHLCKKRLKIPNGFSESNTEGPATPWPKQKEQMYKELRTKHYIEN
jgi:hypothetical protein